MSSEEDVDGGQRHQTVVKVSPVDIRNLGVSASTLRHRMPWGSYDDGDDDVPVMGNSQWGEDAYNCTIPTLYYNAGWGKSGQSDENWTNTLLFVGEEKLWLGALFTIFWSFSPMASLKNTQDQCHGDTGSNTHLETNEITLNSPWPFGFTLFVHLSSFWPFACHFDFSWQGLFRDSFKLCFKLNIRHIN